MKQFLKSTTVFACMALLFCACNDDGTEDVAATAESSTIRLIHAGEERAWVKWTVPSVELIQTCKISWTNEDGTVSGSESFSAVEGVMETTLGQDFTDIPSGTVTDLPSGIYTFTVTSMTRSGASLVEDSSEVYIYDQDTYEGNRPTPTMLCDDFGAWITWTNIPQDCIGVNVQYVSSANGLRTDSGLIAVEEGGVMNLPLATPNTTFTFSTYFKPNAEDENWGLDEIIVANDDTQDYIFPSTAPSAPRSVYARPGKNRFIVYWDVPNVADITSSYVEYVCGADKAKVEIKGTDLIKGLSDSDETPFNACEFTSLSTGAYEISIYNVKNTGAISVASTYTVVVYDETTYPDSAKIKYEITKNSSSEAEIAWDYSPISDEVIDDCWGVIASVSGKPEKVSNTIEQLEEMTEIPSWSYISSVEVGEEIEYTVYFRPADGLDYIPNFVDDDEYRAIPEAVSPDKPTNVQFIPANYSIFIEFDLSDDADISQVVIKYSNVDPSMSTNVGQVTLEKGNFKLNYNNFTALGVSDGEDGIKLDSSYDVEIWTETASGVKSGIEKGESILVYDYAIFQSECLTPTFVYEFGIGYPYGLTITWDDVATYEYIEYLDFTYVYNTEGLTKTVRIEDFDVATILSDGMPGTNYSYVTTFRPAPNSNDIHTTTTSSTSSFPYSKVDKSMITQYTMLGDATEATTESDTGYTGFTGLFNDIISSATGSGSTALSTNTVDRYMTTYGQANKGLTYDLGATYKLAEFYYTPYNGYVYTGFTDSSLSYNYTITKFSLYGTNDEDPANSILLNQLNSDGTPCMDYWEKLLDNVELYDLTHEDYTSNMDYDFNGDEVVTGDDMTWLIENGGFVFTIPEENRVPTRYIKMVFHEAANQSTVYASTDYLVNRDAFLIVELDHTHMGCDVE